MGVGVAAGDGRVVQLDEFERVRGELLLRVRRGLEISSAAFTLLQMLG